MKRWKVKTDVLSYFKKGEILKEVCERIGEEKIKLALWPEHKE